MTIAIIGAGLAGLACARSLTAAGHAVRLFDKGRGPGGRMATRRITADGQPLQFDHGAQYVTARGAQFRAALQSTPMAAWPDAERWVATPGMSALPRTLAGGLDLALRVEVKGLAGDPGAWRLLADGTEPAGPYHRLVLAIPPAQAARLLEPVAASLAATLAPVQIAPCWTAMAAFPSALPLPDTLRPSRGPIGWAARDSAKPGRDPTRECWVIQARPDWSRTMLEHPAATAASLLLEALAATAGAPLPPPLHLDAHRWRFAAVEAPLGTPCVWEPRLGIGLAGDWCVGARAESAFDSGIALAAAIAA